ncbi:MAG: PHP domain-containing protein [Candidatus Aenigmatarchaeota archaeon]
MKGIFHVHTKEFSYDSKVSFEEIKEFCRKKGFSFVALAEHSGSMNKKKMKKLVKKCKEMSKEGLIFIPGLEILTKEGYEVIGIGIKKFIHKKPLEETVNFIHKNKGIAILAHPCKYKNLPKNLSVDGIEVLNFEYDGFFPCPKALQLLEKNMKIFGIFGLDVHRKIHLRNIFAEVKCKLKEKEIINTLLLRKFMNKNSFLILKPIDKVNSFYHRLYLFFHVCFSLFKFLGRGIFKIIRKLKINKNG